ncbi:MAG: DUF4435 domain-containing protein [Bacteroidota bacterium]
MTRKDVSYQEKLNELMLDVSHPSSAGITYILVEGETDIRFFRKFFNLEFSKVENIPGGKAKVEECVERLSSQTALVIGIRDSDFLKFAHMPVCKPNIFLTDLHDIEMVLLSNDEVLNSLMIEYSNIDSDNYISTRNNLMEVLENISYFKWYNELLGCGFNFEAVSILPVITFNPVTCDFSTYFNRIVAKSPSAAEIELDVLMDKINDLRGLDPDKFHLCNGHDLMVVLSYFFRNYGPINNLSKDMLESICRLKFDKNLFYSTNLYRETKQWADDRQSKMYH